MPRPPILPTIDWRAVFHSGQPYEAWLAAAENVNHANAMDENRRALTLDPIILGVLNAMPRPVHVVAIAEDWCGDVVRHVPVLARMADESDNLLVRFVTRMQHKEVFARFLTNGGEAIPKFVFLNDKFVECGNWGPMPDACRELIARGKASGNMAAAREKVAALYNADPGKRAVFAELTRLVDIASTIAP
ncbi:MAG: hypothetical protein AMXMBFR84_07420 [Candidatus Hydrogenedentota bacterium]